MQSSTKKDIAVSRSYRLNAAINSRRSRTGSRSCSIDMAVSRFGGHGRGSKTLWLTVLPSVDGGEAYGEDIPWHQCRHPVVPRAGSAPRGPPRSSRRPVLRDEGRGVLDGPEGGGRPRRGAGRGRSPRVR